MSMWDLKKMYWSKGAKMTVRQMREETARKINSGVKQIADEEPEMNEPTELKDWQKEIMEKNEN